MSPRVMHAGASGPWFEDTFTEGSDTPLENHTPDTSSSGSAWGSGPNSENTELTVLSTGGVQPDADAGTETLAMYPDVLPQANAKITAVMDFNGATTGSDRLTVYLRDTDGTWGTSSGKTGYELRVDADGEASLNEWSSGTETNLDLATSGTVTTSGDVTAILTCDGTSISAEIQHDGGTTNLSATDSTHSAAGNFRMTFFDLPSALFKSLKVELL